MTVNKAAYLFSSKSDCCQEYFWWEYEDCMNSGAAPTNGSNPAPAPTPMNPTPTAPSGSAQNAPPQGLTWYPDWLGANTGCLSDGNQPGVCTVLPIFDRIHPKRASYLYTRQIT